jgi:predicted outer membrane repeat protein
MKTSNLSLQHLLMSLALMVTFAVPSAYAATITVDTNTDTLAGGSCSLRDAVMSVNDGVTVVADCVAATTGTLGTDDTIILPADTYTLALGGLDETATGTAASAVASINPDASVGDLDLLKSVKIIGAGSGTTRIEWAAAVPDATNTDRIFHIYNTEIVANNVDVAIQGVTLSGGKTFEEAVGTDATYNYYLRRAGGALALGAAANVVAINPALTGSENANAGGLGGSTGGESGATVYTLSLSDVVIDGNSAQGDGGGLYIAAPTTATNVVVSNNTSNTNGGGIYNEANTTITNSTISDNTSEGGGGVFATGANTVTIKGSTLSGNTAVGGGGLSSRSGVTVNMVNSTVSGNIGSDVGAGLYTNGAMNLNFVTIAKNISAADSANAGSGINMFPSGSGIITLKNVLLQGNLRGASGTIPANCGKTGSGTTVDSQGHNLSSDTTCDNVTWLSDSTDQNNVDPKIDVLALNAPGTTQTHALLAGSPALGAGVAVALITTDQRGIARDATPDIGAYEVPTTIPTVPPYSSSGGGGCTMNPNAQFDGGLLALLAAAMGGLMLRRRRSATRN